MFKQLMCMWPKAIHKALKVVSSIYLFKLSRNIAFESVWFTFLFQKKSTAIVKSETKLEIKQVMKCGRHELNIDSSLLKRKKGNIKDKF